MKDVEGFDLSDLKQVPPTEPHMHQSVCGQHIETEIRLRVVERDVSSMNSEIQNIRREMRQISTQIEVIQKGQDSLSDLISNQNDTVEALIKSNSQLQSSIGDLTTSIFKEIRTEYRWILTGMGTIILLLAGFKVYDAVNGSMI